MVPFLLPLVAKLGFDMTWFGILVAVNLQTAWLSPPVALAAYFLKGVVPQWQLIGENIGTGFAVQSLHDSFMASGGHRANILGNYNRVGIGVVTQGERIWVTFDFVNGPAIGGSTGNDVAVPVTPTGMRSTGCPSCGPVRRVRTCARRFARRTSSRTPDATRRRFCSRSPRSSERAS